MPESSDLQNLLQMAERAATDGDFLSAGKLLKDVVRIQETELGPLHPDLVSTLNNLAVVAERTGQLGEAEAFYRRAAAIASASLPADHPMVAESHQNLEAFCREHSITITRAATDEASTPAPAREPSAVAGGGTPTPGPTTHGDVSTPVQPPSADRPAPPSAATATPPQPQPPASDRSSGNLAYLAIGAVVLLTLVVLLTRSCSTRETPASTATAEPAAAVPATTAAPAPAPPPAAVTAPTEPPPQPKRAAENPSPAPSTRSTRSSGTLSLAAVQLCQTFSTTGDRWRCDPPAEPVSRGRLVLYTRIRSPRETVVVHRWYQGGTLRQAVKLTIQPNTSEGYRTYSRQNLDDAGNWRVEVANADGALLHEQRFTVR
jgi:hypothetical protein